MAPVIVLFDADCGFCRWSISRIAVWDRRRRLRFVPIRSAEGAAWLVDVDAARRGSSWHVIDRGRRVASAGAAVPVLLRELPGGAPLAHLAQIFPRSTDRLYRAVARRRRALGRILGVTGCRVPAEP